MHCHSVLPPLSAERGKQISQKLLLGENYSFALRGGRGGGYILGEAFASGNNQQFLLNIFVFVILWTSDNEV